jgi:lipopolysaccharide transport system ATP-binding protein
LPTAIRTENLSKIYRLGEIGTGTISRDLERWWAKMKGKEDPFLKIGQANDRAVKGDSDIVYSLRDINFEIQQGEAVGIIGKNGAGKSTLLKILSRVTSPTTGKIEIKGRIASLLEVGTGFHPELTGRENIYLNGAILGMRKKEITRKLDEIIDFSGVERYIDTPVKRYSSGMYVRLAFAVAAHLESEILIVDEVLAVGDAEFQKKCLGKLGDVSKGEGRTVLFVSHNLGAINQLCTKGIVLNKGEVGFIGTSQNAVDFYSNSNEKISILEQPILSKDKFQFLKAFNCDKTINIKSEYAYNESIQIFTEIYIPYSPVHQEFCISIYDKNRRRVFSILEPLSKFKMNKNSIKLVTTFPAKFLTPGFYSSLMCIVHPGIKAEDIQDDVLPFTIIDTGSDFARYDGAEYGCVHPVYSIEEC